MKLYHTDSELYITRSKKNKKKLSQYNIEPINTIKKLFYSEWHYIDCKEIRELVKRW